MALIDLMVLIDKGEFAFHTVIIESFRFKLHSPPGRHHVPLQQVHHLSGKEVVDSVLVYGRSYMNLLVCHQGHVGATLVGLLITVEDSPLHHLAVYEPVDSVL
jgi:hypothetical protein